MAPLLIPVDVVLVPSERIVLITVDVILVLKRIVLLFSSVCTLPITMQINSTRIAQKEK